ncbi:hypothetical protein AMATHDRAFT_52221 [Amanita thiersii Skay4041]|uniref:NUDE domain-containing protein n=1 Tax=Amanita thiersii Skay4041 TaxID=703135 RepID=A0A2A9NUC5_9AGAR|nr:hypothetical protein AMATHDRAFT_52221 [Amanita thiersii Skay4041]
MSLDDSQFDYSSSTTDWRAKYNEVAEMLAETRTELDEFHHASKELEAELENELQRTEKAQQELKIKVSRTEAERDDWKTKFLNLQTTHNTTTTSLQRELDKLRQEHQQLKVQLRELELGNDDLERNERAVSSSLADMEAKYSRALEEKILLEHELLEKAKLEEENQRLKDELRDANDEISILKEQVINFTNASEKMLPQLDSTLFPQVPVASNEDLLQTSPPDELHLSDLSPTDDSTPSIESTPKATLPRHRDVQPALQLADLQPSKSNLTVQSSASLGVSRSSTISSLYGSIAVPRTPTSRIATRNVSTTSTTSNTSTASRNKGVQMVSEMRARVKNLEQKIQTRVPRLRMGSITNRSNASGSSNGLTYSGTTVRSPSSSSSASSKVSTAKTSWESLAHRPSADSKRNYDSETDKKKDSLGDTSGWVLIMEDSPPAKNEEKERRRTSSPGAPSAYRAPSYSFSTHQSSLTRNTMNAGIRRPTSRLSGVSLSTSTTSSMLPTSISRPSTPTFLPIPSNGTTPQFGAFGLTRSVGPGSPHPKSMLPPSDSFRSGIPSPSRPGSGTPSSISSTRYSSEDEKALPKIPPPNFSPRTSKLPTSSTSNSLSQSRIGRPSGRKSTGDPDLALKLQMEKRKRAGSTAVSKNGLGS